MLIEKFENVDKYADLIKKYRQDLHKIPEIGFDLPKTFKYIKGELDRLKVTYEVICDTGIICYFKGTSKDSIAFRTDMDALQIQEENDVPYKSTHPGQSHACGHDGHMSIMLTFANVLSTMKLKTSVVLIFQPAEETPGGAEPMIATGFMEKYHVKNVFGLHLNPILDGGKLGIIKGEMLASVSVFDVEIKGLSSHGALPNYGNDAIVASSAFVQAIQTIISRNIDPITPGVITISSINGGSFNSIICDSVKLRGQIRTFNPQTLATIKKRFEDIKKGISATYNVTFKGDIEDLYPATINDNAVVDKIVASLDPKDYYMIPKCMFSEDFSFFLQKAPGAFANLGVGTSKFPRVSLHNSKLNYDEQDLLYGVKFYLQLLEIFS
jgi:amidohydrolase